MKRITMAALAVAAFGASAAEITVMATGAVKPPFMDATAQ